MITLYTFTTPNGRKVSIMLEELGLPYAVEVVNFSRNEQFAPAFLAVSPNNKIPALVDPDAAGGPVTLFESGAILTYLADKTGRFAPKDYPARAKVMEWLHWQIGGIGPMMGQLGYFGVFAKEKTPAAIDRFQTEVDRLFGVLDRRLTDNAYLGGAEYSIADMATYPWVVNARGMLAEVLGESLGSKPAINRWLDEVGARPAVVRGMAVPQL